MILNTEENKNLIKEFKVETKEKNKTLSIYHGDILKDESDIVAISVYDNEKNKGDLYNAFKENIHKADEYKEERPFLKDEKIWTSLSVSEKHSRALLFIYSSASEGEIISQEDLRSMMKITFATLNSFIFEGNKATSAALPILFRKGIRNEEEYTQYIQTFIFEASECLRKNNSLEELKIYIWHKQEAEFWLDILNGRLTVSLEESISAEQAQELRNDILVSLKKPEIRKLMGPDLNKAVEKVVKNRKADVFPLAREGNKVIDLITKDLITIMDMPHNGNPKQRIFDIKSNRSLIEWFGDYLLSIRIFKEYARNSSPSPLDEYQFLLQFAQVLSYYEQICFTRGGIEHGSK